ncbi:hypothetical protein RSSM_04759 [Rhodopirellula sallentina SM41]|uniref:Uncharacterized protein n=1 Tax=Rhodopirellula sallentina SM41 TaxID=1263870 RepID=M5TX60_9BACT|nr:hypothetical protein RSSM_04759 [Rhodopirellula sallentina SM41]
MFFWGGKFNNFHYVWFGVGSGGGCWLVKFLFTSSLRDGLLIYSFNGQP